MKQPSHTDPDNLVDHPLDYHARHAWDVYLNPNWALRFLSGDTEKLADELTEKLGRPKLKWNGSHNILQWGSWNRAPTLSANLSGGNGKIWFHFSLPWASFTIPDLQAERVPKDNEMTMSLAAHLRYLQHYLNDNVGTVFKMNSEMNSIGLTSKRGKSYRRGRKQF